MNEHSFMPRPRAAPPVSSSKAEAILDAALECFERTGYGNTPVPGLAEAAGVAVGTIYRYFPGKSGLVNALYRRWKHSMLDALTDGLDLERDPATVFGDLWGRLTRFASEHPSAFAFLENHHHAHYLDAESRALTERIDHDLAKLVESWQRSGAVREGDPELLVATAFGAFVGAVRHRRTRGLPITHELGEQTGDAAWQLLSARCGTASTSPSDPDSDLPRGDRR